MLNDYLPSLSIAPPDTRVSETTTRTVTNVNRMVVWGSAFTQTVYRGVGTILDLQTQQDLSNFVRNGGRLFVAGQDVAFALAGNGQANDFVNNILGVGFSSDNANGAFTLTYNATTPLAQKIGRDPFGTSANHAYVTGPFHVPGGANYTPPGSEALELTNLVDLLPSTEWRGKCVCNSFC